MKTPKFLSIILLLFITTSLFAQTDSEKGELKTSLDNIFNGSKSKNYKLVSESLVYSLDDNNRKWKDLVNISNAKEKSFTKRISKKIKAFLNISDSYKIVGYSTANGAGGKRFVVNVQFKSGSQELTTKFYFLKIKNKFALADID